MKNNLKDMETWKNIKDFEGLYQVSNLGRVRSLDRWVWNGKGYFLSKCKILKPALNGNGYQFVILYKYGKKKMYKVHRLVAQAFVPNPQHLPQVNHLNECKTDNRASNLEWCDRSYNINFGSRNKRVTKALSKRVAQIDKDTNEIIRIWPSTAECQRHGFNKGNISQCCQGKHYKTHHGYKWQYIEDSF